MRNRLLLLCLLLSGFSGLAYELLWTRLLSFTFGSTSFSFSAVLAVFFGGLSLGAWLAGKRAAGIERPVRVYAWIEMGIGALGILLYPVISHLDLVFVAVDPGGGFWGIFARLVASVLLLALPTVLMGATLPIVCAAMAVRDEEAGRATALIYAFNTLGAFLGAYLVTYHLIPSLGIFRSVLVSVVVNVLAGALALVSERRTAAAPSVELVPPAAPAPLAASPPLAEEPFRAPGATSRKILVLAPLLTFLIGFAFISLEVVWARLFSSLLGGTIYGVGAVLICFLVGIALGSLLVAYRLPSDADIGIWLAGLQTAVVLSLLLFCGSLTRIAHAVTNLGVGTGGSLVPQHLQLLVVFLTLIIPTLSSGASFPLLVKLVESRARFTGRALGDLYAANTVGAILGSLVTGFVLIPAVGSVGAFLVGMACIGAAAALSGTLLTSGKRKLAGAALAAVALLGVGQYGGFDVTLVSTGPPGQKELYEQFLARHRSWSERLIFFVEGREGTVAVYESAQSRSLRVNGLGQGGLQKLPPHHILESLLVAMIPYVHAEAPRNALVVGLGAGVTVDLLGELALNEITVAEIEPGVVRAVDVIFDGESPVEDERVEVVVDDARHFLLLGARNSARRFDVITSMPAHPWVAPSLFTREFFELARSNLSESGVFSVWFGVTKMDAKAVESLFRAFCSVFPSYVIYYVPETAAYFLVGSPRPLSIDRERIARVQDLPSFRDHFALLDPYFLPARVYATGDATSEPPPPGVVNTDDTAFVEIHSPRAGSGSPVLRDFLPHEFILPGLLRGVGQREFYRGLLEHLLGTPRGELPAVEAVARLHRLEPTLAAAREFLDDAQILYFEGRLALAAGRREEGRALLAKAKDGAGETARRAEKFHALTYPVGSRQRWEALAAIEPSTDVILWMLDIDRQRALERVSSELVAPESDPLGWFLRKAAQGERLAGEDRVTFSRGVAPRILESSRHGLLEVAEAFCRRQDLEQEAEVFAQRRRAVARLASGRLVEQGLAAARAGRLAEAVQAFAEAHRLEPGNEITMRALLVALVRTGDEPAIASLLDAFRFLGRSERYVRALLKAARKGEIGFGEEPPASPVEELPTAG